jgi:hypothetical protein
VKAMFARIFGLLLLIVLLLFGGTYLFTEVQPAMCWSSERIVSADAALAFGKDQIRQDKRFWESIGVTSPEEIEGILNNGICCNASRGDYFINDRSRWKVYIGGASSGRYDFQYEVFFSECKKDVRVEKLATRH